MIHKAQKINSEEWVEGYYVQFPILTDFPSKPHDNSTVHKMTFMKNYIMQTWWQHQWELIEVNPETLKRQITSTGEWRNVDDVEVVKKVIVQARTNNIELRKNTPKIDRNYCGCGLRYSQKDYQDGMCNKCCAPTIRR